MPIFKVVPGYQKYHDIDSYEDVIKYCLQEYKTPNGFIGGLADDPETAILLMELHTASFYKTSGIMLRHMILSFSEDERIDYSGAFNIAQLIADFYNYNYQILFVVHEDHPTPHIHFIMNTVGYDGVKYDGSKADYYNFQNHIKSVLHPYGLSLIVEKYT